MDGQTQIPNAPETKLGLLENVIGFLRVWDEIRDLLHRELPETLGLV